MKKVVKKKRTKKTAISVVDHPRASEKEFTNREIGWLQFNRRVLSEAEDQRNPILERLKFLSISQSNLDEFFMKRVGGLKRQVALGLTSKSSDGKTPTQQLIEIRNFVLPMIQSQAELFKNLKPALMQNSKTEKQIHLLSWNELTESEKKLAHKYYLKNVFPVLTPLSVDPGHPFPFISNLSVSLGVTLKNPNNKNLNQDEKYFARVKIPQVLNQWVRIENTVNEKNMSTESNHDGYRFISLLDLIQQNLSELFPSMQVISSMAFRLTRNADILRDEEDAEDLLEMMEEELRLRRFAEVVRLEHAPNPDPWMLNFLIQELEIQESDVYEIPSMVPSILDYTCLGQIADLPIKELKFDPWTPVIPLAFQEEDPSHIFNLIKHSDQLIHAPYESFSASVEKLIRAASEDPKVLAIKMTLYRTGDNSPFIKALIRAAESGKQVVCLVELKARFDEERNIYWAQELENAGVHVVYGIVGLKTHAKTTLIVRQEMDGLKCYAHIGTGNYNVSTSRFYTDFGLLTCHEEITAELTEFFHYLTGRSLKTNYQHLLLAPINMSNKFKWMIERESENHRKGKASGIIAKMNNMEENNIAISLFNCSQAGVQIDLLVRGFCCLRPGVEGFSKTIKVQSVIGRFLEHSRVFYFRNGSVDPIDGDFFIGSADWMYRNLHSRVECIVPIYDRHIKEKIWDVLQLYLKDQRQSWDMQSDGSYARRSEAVSSESAVQNILMNLAKQKSIETEDNH